MCDFDIKLLLLNLNQRPIAYFPVYRQLTNSTTAGILLSQIMYWSNAMRGEKFYKSDAELIKETSLTSNEFRSAKAKIKKLNFIKIKAEGMPAKSYYYVDYELLASSLSVSLNPPNKNSGIHQTRIVESTKLYITENTSENNKYIKETKKQKQSPHKSEAVVEVEPVLTPVVESDPLLKNINDKKRELLLHPLYAQVQKRADDTGVKLEEELDMIINTYISSKSRTDLCTYVFTWLGNMRPKMQVNYQKPYQSYTKKPGSEAKTKTKYFQYPSETVQEFDDRCDEREAMGDVIIIREYSRTDADTRALSALAEAKKLSVKSI
jgi:hypothetical protein